MVSILPSAAWSLVEDLNTLRDPDGSIAIPGLFAPRKPGYWGSGAHASNEHIRIRDLGAAGRFLVDLFRSQGL